MISTKRYRKEMRWTEDQPESTMGLSNNISLYVEKYGAKNCVAAQSAVPDEVMKALKLTEAKTTKRNKSAQEAARMTVSAFIAQTYRINRKLKKAYAAGNLTARETLRRAGLVCGR